MSDKSFLKKMQGVKPLKKNNVLNIKLNKVKTTSKTKTIIKKIEKKELTINKTEFKKKEFNLSFGEINKDLKRGKIKIDRRLDLHGYTMIEAYTKFKHEIIKSYNNKKRCLLIITGKGVHLSKKQKEEKYPKLFHGKIKNSISDWIKEDEFKNYILTYQNAGIDHGGDGALFVYLRKKKS